MIGTCQGHSIVFATPKPRSKHALPVALPAGKCNRSRRVGHFMRLSLGTTGWRGVHLQSYSSATRKKKIILISRHHNSLLRTLTNSMGDHLLLWYTMSDAHGFPLFTNRYGFLECNVVVRLARASTF